MFKLRAHRWVFSKGLGKRVCKECGLVWLNNAFTRWAIRLGCDNAAHPDYQNQRDKAGKR
jgi:hypothetical protein